MREVCVFLCPSLYKTNTAMVEGLIKNGITVSILDVNTDDYVSAVEAHFMLVNQRNTDQSQKKYQPRLCLAFEETRHGIRAAKDAGMCAIGIASSNRIELERLCSEGAHAVASSVSEFLDDHGVRNYYQVQYLPYALHLRRLAADKVGYPVSLLDTLSGRFLKKDHVMNHNNHNDDDDDNTTDDLFELDPHGQRIIPREILGIKPDSIADSYTNNVGWPQDKIDTFCLDSRELELDIVRMLGRFYGCPDGFLRGFVTTGGTEGNFTGLWWNRDWLQSATGAPPILLTSDQTHYSVSKAAQQLAIEGRLIKSTRNGDIDCNELSRMLDSIAEKEPDRPILMQCNLGTTQTGALDNLHSIHSLLVTKVRDRGQKFAIHVDAALLGACLPVRRPFGDVDYFRDLQVNTMAISGHKFFGSCCICGLCLTTAPFLDECSRLRKTNVEYLTGLHDMTPSGSRSGFSTLSLHNTLCGLYLHTDAHRLKMLVAQCYRNVTYFVRQLVVLIGVDAVIHPPHSLTVCFPRPSNALMKQYQLMPVNLPHTTQPLAGVCVLVNVDRKKIDQFLGDYRRDMILKAPVN